MTSEKIRSMLGEVRAGALKNTRRNFYAVGRAWVDLIIGTTTFKTLTDAGLRLASDDHPDGELFTEENQFALEEWIASQARNSDDQSEVLRRLRKERERIVRDVVERRI